MTINIPVEIKQIIKKLEEKGFEAFIVGGSVRDIFLKKEPKDWDIATSANPTQITKVFKKSYLNNDFGTVTVLVKDKKIKEVEITPYRQEENYKDGRHPEKILWVKDIKEDLSRRDFTINSLALKVAEKNEIIDLFDGVKDIKEKLIRAVGNPVERFNEDSLRMMRAVRFATTLEFNLEEATKKAIKDNVSLIERISKERIKDEFLKIIMSKRAKEGIEMLKEVGLLSYVIPELEENFGVAQNKHHKYDCYQHALFSLDYAAKNDYSANVRIAALLHDIAKPIVKEGEGENATFYNHEVVGAKVTEKILRRLKFNKKDIQKITKLVRYHLFYYNVGEVTEASVRRLIRKVGFEDIDDLIKVRKADRIGSGVPKAEPYKLRHLRYLIEKVSKDPISTKMLKINGVDIIDVLEIKQGPEIGYILDILLSEVLDDPKKNKKCFLIKRAKEVAKKDKDELKKIAQISRAEIDKIETKKEQMTKRKYWVS